MKIHLVLYLLGALCYLLAASMLPSLGIAVFAEIQVEAKPFEPAGAFLLSMFIAGGVGVVLRWSTCIHRDDSITPSEGFAVATLGWMLMAFLGALPYVFMHWGIGGFGFVEAYFESMSGFTTTGSSVFGTAVRDGGYGTIESLPHSLLFWRSLTHWLGGMGIVVLALAILPTLRAGGYQLFQAEVPGPTAERLQPRIRETATILWGAYMLLSLIETVLLVLGDMPWFDALCHTFGTMATGGFSTKDASIGHYALSDHGSALYFESVINLFMFLAGCNFLLHYFALQGRVREYWRNAEFRFYTYMVVGVTLLLTLFTWRAVYSSFFESLRQSLFQTLAIMTTTGFATTNTDIWPGGARLLLVLIMFCGGCAGSTGGGLKQIRIMVVYKYIRRELFKLLRPSLVNRLRIGDDVTLEERTAASIVGLVMLWLAVYGVACFALLVLIGNGSDGDEQFTTATTAVAACLNNIGPGLSRVGATENFHWLPGSAKWLLVLCMLMGRLEVYSVIVLLLPLAWRR